MRDPVTGRKVIERPHQLAYNPDGELVPVPTDTRHLPKGWRWPEKHEIG